MAVGETTSRLARKHGVSAGRIAQKRRQFREDWSRFCGKPVHVVVFSADGLRLAAANSEHAVWIWDATPLTPERRDEREAVSVGRYWLGKSLPNSEVVRMIGDDKTISDAIRKRALTLTLDTLKER